jgi:amidophosphoribosyltransferase
MGVIRNHYVGRTFIQPSQSMRDFGVKVKLNYVRDLLKDKRVLIIEDSIIRGTTAKTRIKTLRKIGAKEVHMLVSCPPHRFPCHYGIDFSTRGELIAASKTVEEIRDFIGLDSLGYLSMENLVKATHIPRNDLCFACFDGTPCSHRQFFPNSAWKGIPPLILAFRVYKDCLSIVPECQAWKAGMNSHNKADQ